MRAIRISVAVVLGGLILFSTAPGAGAQQGARTPEADQARARKKALEERLNKLEREKAEIESRIDAVKRELARAQAAPDAQPLPPARPGPRRQAVPMPNPIPPLQPRVFPRAPQATPELRQPPRVTPTPAPLGDAGPERVPENWVPGEINGLRFYVIPLAQGGEPPRVARGAAAAR